MQGNKNISMKTLLLSLLVLLSIALIIIGFISKIVPPVLTRIGFIIIVILFYNKII